MIRTIAAGVAVLAAAVLTACTPHVAGDSLTFTSNYPTTYVTGATVVGNIGHDVCQDEQQIVDAANSQVPDRLMLAFTGNFYSPQVRPAYDFLGEVGLGQRYADCIRSIRGRIPVATTLVVGKALACGASAAPHGGSVLNDYMQKAVLGGRYFSGTIVTPLLNARWSTALDDRLTPGHVYRTGDAGGQLRAGDDLHLTHPYGDSVYGGVLSKMAAGTDVGGINTARRR